MMHSDAASRTNAAWQAQVAAAMLYAMRWVSALGLGLLLISLWSYTANRISISLWIILIYTISLVVVYIASRLELDARLFLALAHDLRGDATALGEFDRAMRQLGLMREDKLGRDLPARVRGALRLVRWQIALVITQVVAFIVAHHAV